MGHSFVRRFELFLSKSVDAGVRRDLNLSCSAQRTFLGVGGRTVDKLSKFDLDLVRRLQPQIVILERLHAECQVKTIVVCQTITRAKGLRDLPSFNDRVALLNQYLSVVLETLPFAFFWRHTTHRSHFIQRRGTHQFQRTICSLSELQGRHSIRYYAYLHPGGGSRSQLTLGPFLHPHFPLFYMSK